MRGLKFHPGTHRYYLDGKPVPGVTGIIGVLDKPALPKWAAKTVAEYVADNPDGVENLRSMGREPMVAALKELPWQKRDEAAERGHKFHYYAEKMLLGEVVEVPESQVPLVESALDFMEKWGIQPVLTETAVGSRAHRYAGTFDMVADHNRGPRAIWDWKSGKRIYSGACFQLNAYGHAEFRGLAGDEHPMSDLGIEAAYGIHIRADGYDVYPVKYGPDVYREFLVIREAYDLNKRAEGNWREPGSGYVGRAIQDQSEENAA